VKTLAHKDPFPDTPIMGVLQRITAFTRVSKSFVRLTAP
jgi:hypothetical protein